MDSESLTDAEANSGHRRRRSKKKKNRTGLKVFIGLMVLLLIAVGGVTAYALYLANLFDSGTENLSQNEVFKGEQPVAEDGEPINILLMGSDARDEDVDYSGDARGNRSDAIMVLHLSGDRSNAQVLSLPRDLWVPIEGHGNAKINAAMSFGGLPLATQTVGEFIGAPIHHVAIIDFEGFKALTDSVGGVSVNSPQDFESGGSTFTEGANYVYGEDALNFVRARKNFADGDLQRVRNQQEFLRALTAKMISSDTLTSPARVNSMIREFSPYMTVDEQFTAATITGMAVSMRDVRPGDVDFFSAPIAGASRSADGQAILEVDESEQEKIQKAFQDDTVADYAATAEEQGL